MYHRDDGTHYTRGDRLVPGVPCTVDNLKRYGPPDGQNTPDNPEIFWCHNLEPWNNHKLIDAHHEIVMETGKELGSFPTIIVRAPSHDTQRILGPRTGAGLITVKADAHITAAYGQDSDHCQLMVHIYTTEDAGGKMRLTKPQERVIVQDGYRAASVEVWQIKDKWPDHRTTASGVEEVPSRALQSNDWRDTQGQQASSANSQPQQNNGRGNGAALRGSGRPGNGMSSQRTVTGRDMDPHRNPVDSPGRGNGRNRAGGQGRGNGRNRAGGQGRGNGRNRAGGQGRGNGRNRAVGQGRGNSRNPAGGQGRGFGRAQNRGNGGRVRRHLDGDWRNRDNAAPAGDDLGGFTAVEGQGNGRN